MTCGFHLSHIIEIVLYKTFFIKRASSFCSLSDSLLIGFCILPQLTARCQNLQLKLLKIGKIIKQRSFSNLILFLCDGQCNGHLPHIFPFSICIRNFTGFNGLIKKNLSKSFVRINFCRQRRSIGNF